MARTPAPWYWKQRRAWFVTICGQRHRLADTKSEAYERFHEMMAQPMRRQVSGESVVALVDLFLEWVQKNRAAETYRWYHDFLQSFVDSIPATLTIRQLKPFHVQQWADATPGHSTSTRHGRIKAVKRAIRWAHQQGYIGFDPLVNLQRPPMGRREVVITPEEFEAIRLTCTDDAFRDLLTIAWETGARPQEIIRVEARHFEQQHARWVFPQSEAKGKRRPRIVYLTKIAEDITARCMAECSEGPIFRNRQGRPWVSDAINCRFARLKEKLGQRYCLYHFRHSFATRKLREGLDPLMVAELLGHSDPSMLAKVYQHLAHDPAHMLSRLRQAGS
ncbi:MAG: site-specific integrase [Planctomycetaceae bacterium]|nr:site-specific integrase [Planctomycetaceae bacterium]